MMHTHDAEYPKTKVNYIFYLYQSFKSGKIRKNCQQ